MLTVSFRALLSVAGCVFVGMTGTMSLWITWTQAIAIIDPMSEALEQQALRQIESEIKARTNAVQERAMQGRHVHESSDFGCCSAASKTAKYVQDFDSIRQFHWETLKASTNVLLSYSGTMAGGLVLYEHTSNMDEMDGGQSGVGNFRWTVSDQSTNWTYYQWYSNTYQIGGYAIIDGEWCNAINLQYVNANECPLAAAHLGYTWIEAAAANGTNGTSGTSGTGGAGGAGGTPSSRQLGCCLDDGSGVMYTETREGTCPSQRVCFKRSWYKRNRTFIPACDGPWPCKNGSFVYFSDPDFNASLFSVGNSNYNASVRSWWKGAVANGDLGGDYCRLTNASGKPQCRNMPGWGRIYRSNAAEDLVLPSVSPIYVNGTDTVRAVFTLGVGLKYLDEVIQTSIAYIGSKKLGFIVDVRNGRGMLVASHPGGVSSTTAGVITALSARSVGDTGSEIQGISEDIQSMYGQWASVPQEGFFERGEDRVRFQRITDDYGMDWLAVLSIPKNAFTLDLENRRSVVIIIVASLTLVIALFLFAVSCTMTREFMSLASKMSEVAEMKMATVATQDRTRITELSKMESSFNTMSRRLKHLWDAERQRMEELKQDKERWCRRRVREAEAGAIKLGHPMVVCQASYFVKMPGLLSYETLRDNGRLEILDTEEELQEFKRDHVIVFLSHQWLSYKHPDPKRTQHRAMIAAIKQLQKRLKRQRDNSEPSLDDIYVWVDYGSIAQEHRGMQMIAVDSLPVYSAMAHAFVMIVPRATHEDRCEDCGIETYNARGWCRTEMLSKICGSGLDHFYIMDSVDGELKPVTPEVFQSLPFEVFEGQFTCCALEHRNVSVCDREHLVVPMLGLYSLVLKQGKQEHMRMVAKVIEESKERYFPHHFTYINEDGESEERELFGKLPQDMEAYLGWTKHNTGHTSHTSRTTSLGRLISNPSRNHF